MKKGSLKMAEVKIMVLTIMIILSGSQFFSPMRIWRRDRFSIQVPDR